MFSIWEQQKYGKINQQIEQQPFRTSFPLFHAFVFI
ncbi:hypothetical protein pb186bvf_006268 [Paramecium bursaria]